MTTHPVRRGLGALAAATLVLSLAGCGGDDSADDDGSPDGGSARVLDEDALEGALLTADDLPDGYAESEPNDDDDAETGTCLDDIADFDDREDVKPEEEATVELTATTASGESQVSSSAESYADAATAAGAIEAFTELAQGCPKAQGTGADGVTYDLTITTDDAVTLDGADAQVSVLVDGSLSAQGQVFAAKFSFVVASAGNNLAAVGGSDFAETFTGEGATEQAEELAQTQLDRIVALT